MGYTQCGNCPRCGAPIWVEAVSWSILPPLLIYSCACFPQPRIITTTGTNTEYPIEIL